MGEPYYAVTDPLPAMPYAICEHNNHFYVSLADGTLHVFNHEWKPETVIPDLRPTDSLHFAHKRMYLIQEPQAGSKNTVFVFAASQPGGCYDKKVAELVSEQPNEQAPNMVSIHEQMFVHAQRNNVIKILEMPMRRSPVKVWG